MHDAPPVPIEALLAHEGWVRGLARSLVSDDSRADDVVQETWMTALRDPPREGGSLRSWLGAVVRSRAVDSGRAASRRGIRERAASRREAVGSAADAAAATETHRMLVAAVMALEEPYRSAVILRFFEGLPPREVGARTGVTAEAARTRVKRGVEMLRARLDASHGGDRRRWTALVLPIAGIEAPRAPGGKAMGSAAKAGLAAALAALLAVGTWWALRDGGAEGDAAAAPADASGAADAASAPNRNAARAARPTDAATDPGPTLASPPAAPAVAPGALVRLRFVDENGAALGPETVKQRWGGAGTTPALALADDRALRGDAGGPWFLQLVAGTSDRLRPVGFDDSGEGVRLRERVPKGRWRLVAFPGASASSVSHPFAVAEDGLELPVDVVLSATPLRLVRVVDENSAPVAGATVVPRFEFGDDAAFVDGPPVTTDSVGECRLPVESGVTRTYQRPPTWWATAPGRAASFRVRPDANANVNANAGTGAEAPLVVKLGRTGDIEGEAYLSDGAPAAGRTVAWRRKGRAVVATCDDQGRFVLKGIPTERRVQIFLVEDADRPLVTGATAEVKAGETVHVRIGAPAAEPSARVVVTVTAGGRPVRGVGVMCGQNEGTARLAMTGADGTAAVGGLPPGVPLRLMLMISDARVSDDFGAQPSEFAPLGTSEERRLALDLPAGAVRVLVVGADGKPVPGAHVIAKPADANVPSPAGWKVRPGYGAFAGDDGTARLVGLPAAGACNVTVFDESTGEKGAATAVAGTWDAPAEVTVTLSAK